MSPKWLTSYAQNREDIILSGFFKNLKNGLYVDIGASDPVKYSVTKYFYDMGWKGINIEPIPKHYKNLERLRQRDINLNIGISNKTGTEELTYYPNGDGLSTLSSEMTQENNKNPTVFTRDKKQLTIKVTTLKKVFEEYLKDRTINFMKVDVEGYEYEVIRSNDWTKYRPQLICIEVNHVYNDWKKILFEHNYKKVFFDGINNYYIAKEVDYLAENFSYVQTILPQPIISNEMQEEIKKLEDQVCLLSKESERNKRTRYAAANLLRSIDRMIMHQLGKLNTQRPIKTAPKSDLVITEDMKKNEALNILRSHDVSSLYFVDPKPRFIYRVLVFVYRAPVRLIYRIFKGLRSKRS